MKRIICILSMCLTICSYIIAQDHLLFELNESKQATSSNKSIFNYPCYSHKNRECKGQLAQVIKSKSKTIVKVKYFTNDESWNLSKSTKLVCKNPENFEEEKYILYAYCVTKQGKYKIKMAVNMIDNLYDRHSFNLKINEPYIIEMHFEKLPLRCKTIDLFEFNPEWLFYGTGMLWENIVLE